ncbi:serine/threonine protein kinase [Congregibacter sp.]|uniref:serine/threonine protein kinase n=1 Tax=Congregibacter sp. TaxID=2744308 RepID=UPI003F6BA14E
MSKHPFDVLTPDAIIDAVEAAGFVSDARLLALNSYENRVYQVGIEDDTPVIVKFYRPGRWTEEQLREEHSFSEELVEAEIPVVAPLKSGSGETVHRWEGLLYTLFPRRGGHAPEFDNLDNLLVLGRTLARIHAIGATKPFSYRPKLEGQHIIDESRSLLPDNFIPTELKTAYLTLLDDLERELAPKIEQMETAGGIRIHGDCHGGNILWRDDTANFVDLDDCMTAPAIQDLWMFLSGEPHEQEIQLGEVVAGYEEFFEFDPRELHWIETLRTLRIIRYAAWLARRWDDPAFPKAFPWFNSERYWSDHILELREQFSRLQEPVLRLL